jgi:hypothetical protein
MADLPLEAATADIIARYKRGHDMLASAAIALRKLKERIDAGEAGADWDWTSYRTMHLEAHITKRWINTQLKLAPPGATDGEIAKNVEKHRQYHRDATTKSRDLRKSQFSRTTEHSQAEPEYQEPVRQVAHDVTYPERAAVADPKPKPPEAHWNADDGAGSFSETNARQSAPAAAQPGPARLETPEDPVEAGGAEWKPPHLAPPHDGMVAYWVDPNNPLTLFMAIVAIGIRVSKELAPEDAVKLWPQDIPLASGDFEEFVDWLGETAERWRKRHGNGNAAALEAAE